MPKLNQTFYHDDEAPVGLPLISSYGLYLKVGTSDLCGCLGWRSCCNGQDINYFLLTKCVLLTKHLLQTSYYKCLLVQQESGKC